MPTRRRYDKGDGRLLFLVPLLVERSALDMGWERTEAMEVLP
jgi:hypothetical protein